MDELAASDFLADQADWLSGPNWMFEPEFSATDMNFTFQDGNEDSLAYSSVEDLDFNMLQMEMMLQNMKQSDSGGHLLLRAPSGHRFSDGPYDPVAVTVPGTRKRAVRFTKVQIETLKEWYDRHIHNPYLNGKEIEVLVRETGLEARQIRIWFSKVRARQRKRQATSHPTRNVMNSDSTTEIDDAQSKRSKFPDVCRSPNDHSQSEKQTLESVTISSLDNLPGSPVPRAISPGSDSPGLNAAFVRLDEPVATSNPHKAHNEPVIFWWLETLPSSTDDFEMVGIDHTLNRDTDDTRNEVDAARAGHGVTTSIQLPLGEREQISTSNGSEVRLHCDDESLFRSDISSRYGSRSSQAFLDSHESDETASDLGRFMAILGRTTSRQSQVHVKARVERNSEKVGKTYASSINSVSSRGSSCSYEAFGPRRGRRGPRNLENKRVPPLSLRMRNAGAQEAKVTNKSDIALGVSNTQEPEITGNPLKGASCQVCTSRKIKCDKIRPRCGQCERSGHNCKFVAYQCTFCPMSFASRWMWVRHEESTHVAPYVWICRQPARHHHTVHFFGGRLDECWERPLKDRQFTRKDGLRQHLLQMHQFHSAMHGYDLDEHRQTQDLSMEQLSCPICRFQSGSWAERINHVARHFEAGEGLPRKSVVAP